MSSDIALQLMLEWGVFMSHVAFQIRTLFSYTSSSGHNQGRMFFCPPLAIFI